MVTIGLMFVWPVDGCLFRSILTFSRGVYTNLQLFYVDVIAIRHFLCLHYYYYLFVQTCSLFFTTQHSADHNQTHKISTMVFRFAPTLLVLITSCCSVNGFSIQQPQAISSRRTRVALEASPVTAELWLDLRGTSLTPATALSRLEGDLEQEGFVDRILVDEDSAEDEDERLIIVGQNGEIQGMKGLLVHMPESGILSDPIPAMTMASSGGWVVVENEAGEPSKRQEGVASLLQVMAGGTCVLSMGDDDDEGCSGGGVAWICETKADILHAGTAIRSLENVESTLGGILLSSSSSDSALQCALMLPFDEVLWEAATLMFLEQPEPVVE
jgi:hypothetical protein